MCVVTGSSVGIGKACAEKFEAEGYQVFNLDIQAGDSEHSRSVLTCARANEDCYSAVYDSAGRIDTLICNAGVHFSATIEDMTLVYIGNV